MVFRAPKNQTGPAELLGTGLRKYQKLPMKEKQYCLGFLVLLPKHHYQAEFVIHSSKSSFFRFRYQNSLNFSFGACWRQSLGNTKTKSSEKPKRFGLLRLQIPKRFGFFRSKIPKRFGFWRLQNQNWRTRKTKMCVRQIFHRGRKGPSPAVARASPELLTAAWDG